MMMRKHPGQHTSLVIPKIPYRKAWRVCTHESDVVGLTLDSRSPSFTVDEPGRYWTKAYAQHDGRHYGMRKKCQSTSCPSLHRILLVRRQPRRWHPNDHSKDQLTGLAQVPHILNLHRKDAKENDEGSYAGSETAISQESNGTKGLGYPPKMASTTFSSLGSRVGILAR